jgi:hypothetical protein
MPLALLLATCLATIPRYTHTKQVHLHGISVSPTGLVALLAHHKHLFPLHINDRDVDVVNTPEGLTLLQLLQNIDLAGPLLRPELLSRRFAETAAADRRPTAADVELERVVLTLDGANLLQIASTDGSSAGAVEVPVSAFEALALSLRHAVPIEVEDEVEEAAEAEEAPVNRHGSWFADCECSERYPAAYTKFHALAQRASLSKGVAGLPVKELGGEGSPEGPLDLAEAIRQVVPRPATPPVARIDGPSPSILRAALRIATEKGDAAAVRKISALLDELGAA